MFLLLFILLFIPSSHSFALFQGSCSAEGRSCSDFCVDSSEDEGFFWCECNEGREIEDDGKTCTQHSSPAPTSHSHSTASFAGRALSFDGRNFIQFTAPHSAEKTTNVTIEFRTSFLHGSGILFFAGLYDKEDFFSVALDHGKIIYRFDCGEGPIDHSLKVHLKRNHWHMLNVYREECRRASIRMDDDTPSVKELSDFTEGELSMADGVFVGGVPTNVEFLEEKARASSGFIGCVRRVEMNDVVLLDTARGVNEMVAGEHVKHCEEHVHHGHVGTVHHSRRDVKSTVTTTTVLPPTISPPSTTPRATTKEPMKSVSGNVAVEFSGEEFLEESAAEMEEYTELRVDIKPRKEKGLIFHWDDGHHHLSLFIDDSYVKAELSMGGADTTTLSSLQPIAMNVWHTVELWRSGRGILLKVSGQGFVESEVTSSDRKTFPPATFFIGGTNVRVSTAVRGVGAFQGCMKNLWVEGVRLSLSSPPSLISSGKPVTSLLPLCSADPCTHSHCPHDCATDAAHAQVSCLCPFPSYGPQCEKMLALSDGAFRFSGHSHMQFTEHKYLDYVAGAELNFSMEVKVDAAHLMGGEQVLLYAGDDDEPDFIRIVVNREGKVQVSLNLGEGVTELVHPDRLKADTWTTVECIRERRVFRITVDGHSSVSAETKEGSEQLNLYNSIFIGGRPSLPSLRSDGLHGCMEWIRIGPSTITHPRQADKAVNVGAC